MNVIVHLFLYGAVWCGLIVLFVIAWHLAAEHHRRRLQPTPEQATRAAQDQAIALTRQPPPFRTVQPGAHPCGCIVITRADGAWIAPCPAHDPTFVGEWEKRLGMTP